MRGERPPAFQFYATDWLADANVNRMTAEERGYFINLLCYQWLEGSLPGDPKALAEMLRAHSGRFAKAWDRILSARFESRGDGRLVNRRLEAQRKIQEDYRIKKSIAGALGNEKRWGRVSHSDRTPIATGSRGAIANDRSPVSSLQSPIKDHVEGGFEFAEGTEVAASPLRACSHEAVGLAGHLSSAILSHKPDLKDLQGERRGRAEARWAEDIDLAIRIDKRSPEKLRAVIDWCHRSPEGSFWRANLLSGKKLRAQYDVITAQMERGRANGTGVHHVVTRPETGRNIPPPPADPVDVEAAKKAIEEMKRRVAYRPNGESK